MTVLGIDQTLHFTFSVAKAKIKSRKKVFPVWYPSDLLSGVQEWTHTVLLLQVSWYGIPMAQLSLLGLQQP